MCQKSISYICKNFEQNSVSCEKCNMWYHFEYVGIEGKNWMSLKNQIYGIELTVLSFSNYLEKKYICIIILSLKISKVFHKNK